jgi:hypothetical protein
MGFETGLMSNEMKIVILFIILVIGADLFRSLYRFVKDY